MLITDGLRFSGIAARLGAAIGSLMIGSSGRSTGLYGRHSYMRPTRRQQRDPNNPHQQARIMAAAEKRERRAKKLAFYMLHSTLNNRAHADTGPSLNPFHIAH